MINFYTANNCPDIQNKVIYRNSKLFMVILFSVNTCLLILLLDIIIRPLFYSKLELQRLSVGYFIILLLFLNLFFYSNLRKRFNKDNWLMVYDDNLIYIKYRSYLNQHFNKSDIQVFSFTFSSVISCNKVISNIESAKNKEGVSKLRTYKNIEFKFNDSNDLIELNKRLKEEVERKAPKIGISRTKHIDYPVKVTEDNLLQLQWNGISPSINHALTDLQEKINISTTKIEIHTYDKIDKLSKSKIDEHIQILVQSGDKVSAIAFARKAFNFDLVKAKQYVENLSTN